MDEKSLTCSVIEFAREVGIKDKQARTICAGLYPPPLIVVGRETRVIRARIPEWLDGEAERESERRRPGAETFGDAAAEPKERRHDVPLCQEG